MVMRHPRGSRAVIAARLLASLLALLVGLLAATPAEARRVALVIGNAAYSHAGRLANTVQDAKDVAAALGRLEFDVTLLENVTAEAFEKAVGAFIKKAQGAEVALFFYAGHALQLGATNYLMPVDARLASELAVKRETIAAQDVVELMEGAARMSLVFLDACRNNPIAEQLRTNLASSGRSASVSRGLGRIEAKGRDTLIVYSAEPGQVAEDGVGKRNSPFATGLLKHIETAGVEVEIMLKRVTAEVRAATGNKQQPERLSKLQSEFYFKAGQVAMVPVPPATPSPRPVPVVVPQPAPCDTIRMADGACLAAGSGRAFKDSLHDGKPCPFCPDMVAVPAGSFTMGSPADEPERSSWESPQVKMRIAKPFAVGRFAVTRGEFAAFVTEAGHKTDGGCYTWSGAEWKQQSDKSWRLPGIAQDDRHPVVCVNWEDAQAYVKWLSGRTGQPYRLLSEAEREYVARAGTTTPYWWGRSITAALANYDGNYVYAGGGSKGEYRRRTVPVDSFQANPWGLYNVHGNVWEWTEDCWNDSHNSAHIDGSARTTGDCSRRVVRGGSWGGNPGFLRAADRSGDSADGRNYFQGFRVGRTF